MVKSQSGFAQYLLLLTLFAGIGLAVYLTQFSQVFKPKASEDQRHYSPDALLDPSKTVPGQIIVKYKAGRSPTELKAKRDQRQARASSIQGRLANRVGDLQAKATGENTTEEQVAQIESTQRKIGFRKSKKLFNNLPSNGNQSNDTQLQNIEVVEASSSSSLLQVINDYQSLPEVEYAQPNYINSLDSAPNDPYYSNQWAMKKIGMEEAWTLSDGDPNLIVAIIDSGIDFNNPDLSGRVIAGPNFSTEGVSSDVTDQNGHGTAVAGLIGAAVNNGYGIAGVNKNIKILTIKVFDHTGTATEDMVNQAIVFAANNGAKVINYSGTGYLGAASSCPSSDPAFQSTVDYAVSRGVLFVEAAGNQNDDVIHYNSGCNNVFSVGGTNQNDQRAAYSNWGTGVSISAPGGDNSCPLCGITTYWLNKQIVRLTGTSFSAPEVAGVAALVLAKNPSLSVDSLKELLIRTADPISTDLRIGKRLNAFRALSSLSPPVNKSATLTASPNPCTITTIGTCTSTISWTSQNVSDLKISIKENPGSLFASGASGSQDAPWIRATGATFEAYSGTELLASLFVKGTTDVGTGTETPPPHTGILSAAPNPCSIVTGETCTSVISWNSSHGDLKISIKEAPGSLFASGASGSQAAPWIRAAGATFEAWSGGELRDSLFVKGVAGEGVHNTGILSASPNPCTITSGETCISTINWNSTMGNLQIRIKEVPGSVFASGVSGSQDAPWIRATGATFEAYSGETLVDSLFVKGVN